jgi:hypothetical protein
MGRRRHEDDSLRKRAKNPWSILDGIMSDDGLRMRDLAKSMMDCAWAISVFGVRQMTSLLAGNAQSPAKQVAGVFDQLTSAATKTFDDSAQTVYRAGASVQNAMIDVLLGGAMFARRRPAQNAAEPTPATALETSASATDSSR